MKRGIKLILLVIIVSATNLQGSAYAPQLLPSNYTYEENLVGNITDIADINKVEFVYRSKNSTFEMQITLVRLDVNNVTGTYVLSINISSLVSETLEYEIPDALRVIIQNSVIKIIYPSTTKVGEITTVKIIGALRTEANEKRRFVSSAISFSNVVRLLTIRARLEANDILLSASPRVHGLEEKANYTYITWNHVNIKNIFFEIDYVINETEIEISISQRRVTLNSWEEKVITVTLNNTGYEDSQIEIIYPNWMVLKSPSNKLNLPAKQSVQISFSIKLDQGKYTGNILFLDNQQVINTITVEIMVINPIINILQTLLIIGFVLSSSSMIYLIYTRKKTMRKNIKVLKIPDINLHKGEIIEKQSNFMRKLKISDRERNILQMITDRPGLTQQNIADSLGVSKATASRIISKLEVKGLIMKEGSGMSNLIYLTSAGKYYASDEESKEL